MEKCPFKTRYQGFTLIELLVLIAIVAIMAMLVYPGGPSEKARALRINCVNNLKQCGLAFRVWEGDNNYKFPPQVSAANGGSMESITGPNVFRHFQVASNELSTPKVVFCPKETDRDRFVATNFTTFCNSNISFFIGVDASETNAAMVLAGDHNLTNGLPIRNSILEVSTNRATGWTSEMHNKVGNLCLADGSVRQLSIAELQAAVANTGVATNRLQMPILGP